MPHHIDPVSDTIHNWPPPPPPPKAHRSRQLTPLVGGAWAAATATMIAVATQHFEVGLGASMVTFGLATVALLVLVLGNPPRAASPLDAPVSVASAPSAPAAQTPAPTQREQGM